MTKAELQYPFDTLPEPGGIIDVAPGIKWLRMPLPMALDHINLYLVEDHDGWWVIDTGMGLGNTQELWQKVMDNELQGKPIKAVLCTHMHPDHIGQAGWICDNWRVPLYMSSPDYYQARSFRSMTSSELNWTTEQFYRRAGLGDDFIENMKKNMGGFAKITEPMPTAFHRLIDGQYLTIGDDSWRVITGYGHCPEHICLYSETQNILISGDQVIPRITSNVSVNPGEPEANPLRVWLESHQKFLDLLPPDPLILPSHNTPFYGLHARLHYLIAHHEDHMLAIEEACIEPKTAVDLLPVLFKRKLDGQQLHMALGECIAHLHLLMERDAIARTLHDDGVYYFSSIDESITRRAERPAHELDDGPVIV
jgi:glyoxylase-like metal-dependent hydrolase (beta-lactamase superfamily II)